MQKRSRIRTPARKGAEAQRVVLRLFDPRKDDVAFKVERLHSSDEFTTPQRFNYFTVLWIEEGEGFFDADLEHREFSGPALLFFNPVSDLLPHSEIASERRLIAIPRQLLLHRNTPRSRRLQWSSLQ